MKNTKIRRFILSAALVTGLIAAPFDGLASPVPTAQAATATKQKDEYESSLATYIEQTMSHQMIAKFSGSSGTKAKIEDSTYQSYHSIVTFTFEKNKLASIATGKRILAYIAEAISVNPNLCTLSTHSRSYWSDPDVVTVEVYSLLGKDEHRTAIRQYKEFLADIERVPKQDESMTDTEILLYLHDRLIQQANYAKNTEDPTIFIPYTMASTGVVVCQSYAAVMNTLMRDLGFTSYMVLYEPEEESGHAWNVVKLDGKWTTIDATWDDPTNNYLDTVWHKYFLVAGNSYSGSHTLSADYKTRLGGITSKWNNSVSILPKSKSITTPVCYHGSIWFYVKGGEVYRWDGVSEEGVKVDSFEKDSHRCVGVIDDTVYVGGSDGLYTYDPEGDEILTNDPSKDVEGLFYYSRSLYWRSGSKWYKLVQSDGGGVSYEDLNGTSRLEKVTLVKPGKPTIVAKKSSAKSIRVSVTKRAASANSGYQVQVATNASFTGAKKKTFTGNTTTVTGLTKGVKYYVRVRGIYKKDYLMKYGTWSGKKKV